MLTDIHISKARLSKIIQSSRFLGKTISNLNKKAFLDLVVPLAKDVLRKLPTKATSSVLEKLKEN